MGVHKARLAKADSPRMCAACGVRNRVGVRPARNANLECDRAKISLRGQRAGIDRSIGARRGKGSVRMHSDPGCGEVAAVSIASG